MERAVVVEKLCKSYNQRAVVDRVSFSIPRGEVFGLLGANGAGKSTTVECIIGTRIQDRGRVRILGMDPREKRRTLFEQVGVQFQEADYQQHIRVGELCELTASLYKKPRDYGDLLCQFGLDQKRSSMVAQLSGGLKQRLFIVLALIPDPVVLFLDELTTGLDLRARRDVWDILLKLKEQGMTMLVTSHFMDEVAALCDTVMILRKGVPVFHGTLGEAVEMSPCGSWEDAYLWYAEGGTHDEHL